MIITKTPFRMSFFGGGTDIPDYFNTYKGAVISATFDKYVYVTVRRLPKFFDYTNELVYSKLERVKSVEDFQHPMVKNAMKMFNMKQLHIAYDADLPARSGLGTSSSFAVGLVHAFYYAKSLPISQKSLADDAIQIERVLCKEMGGWQDQIAVSYGGLNRIDFYNNEYKVTPIKISKNRLKELNKHLLLFFTGFTRASYDIQKNTAMQMSDKHNIYETMFSIVDEAQEILENEQENLDKFGFLLDKTWKLKRKTGATISSSYIDELYEKGIRSGAIGGKLLGAGGGGFLLFYVPLLKQNDVRSALNLMEVPFKFETKGSSIIYYDSKF